MGLLNFFRLGTWKSWNLTIPGKTCMGGDTSDYNNSNLELEKSNCNMTENSEYHTTKQTW